MKRVQELDNNRKEGGALSFILYGPKQISNFRAITLSPCGFLLFFTYKDKRLCIQLRVHNRIKKVSFENKYATIRLELIQ